MTTLGWLVYLKEVFKHHKVKFLASQRSFEWPTWHELLTVLYSVVVRGLTAQKHHLWSPPAPVHRLWSFLSPCPSKTMVMGPTDPEPDPWAGGLDLTFLPQTCSKVMIPAALTADRLPARPWICLITTHLSNCLNSWLNISCCLWSCPASSLGQPGPCPGDIALGSLFPGRAAALAASWQ